MVAVAALDDRIVDDRRAHVRPGVIINRRRRDAHAVVVILHADVAHGMDDVVGRPGESRRCRDVLVGRVVGVELGRGGVGIELRLVGQDVIAGIGAQDVGRLRAEVVLVVPIGGDRCWGRQPPAATALSRRSRANRYS